MVFKIGRTDSRVKVKAPKSGSERLELVLDEAWSSLLLNSTRALHRENPVRMDLFMLGYNPCYEQFLDSNTFVVLFLR